jgi:hypothetical protein
MVISQAVRSVAPFATGFELYQLGVFMQRLATVHPVNVPPTAREILRIVDVIRNREGL